MSMRETINYNFTTLDYSFLCMQKIVKKHACFFVVHPVNDKCQYCIRMGNVEAQIYFVRKGGAGLPPPLPPQAPTLIYLGRGHVPLLPPR